MAVDTAAKRASALSGLSKPYLRLVVPDGSVDLAAASGMYSGLAPSGDVTGPVPVSFTIDATGLVGTIVWDEAASIGTGGTTGFVLTPTNGGAAITITYDESDDGTTTWGTALSRAVSSTETFTWGYTNPGNGVEDGTGNDAANFSAQVVTNESTVNGAPTDISLSSSSVLTTGGLNAVVGTLSTTDPDAGDTFTYALVVGTGDTDNASFNISGANLRCNDPSGLTPGAYSVRIQTTDSAANPHAEAFTITVVEPGGGSIYEFNSFLSGFRLRF